MIGLGVSALLRVNVGTVLPAWSNSKWLKYTFPFETRSTRPSPLMSLKYCVVFVLVVDLFVPTTAVKVFQPTTAFAPKEFVELLDVEKLLIPFTLIGSPYTTSPLSVLICGR